MQAKPLSDVMALQKFFGYRPGDTLREFKAEIDKLTGEEKTELAALAAKELGVELVAAPSTDVVVPAADGAMPVSTRTPVLDAEPPST